MAVKLHRCPVMFVKYDGHPCWKVQKALDEAGVEYELVKGPLRAGKRDEVERISGQRKYPVIEFEDGTVVPRRVERDGGADRSRRAARPRRRSAGGRRRSGSRCR